MSAVPLQVKETVQIIDIQTIEENTKTLKEGDNFMKIIDFEKHGNVLRFILGDDTDTYYHGDDWNKAPYEHNAGRVYKHYFRCFTEIALPLRYHIAEPADDWHYKGNSPYCKNDFKERKVPCLIVSNLTGVEYFDLVNKNYAEEYPDADVFGIYFGEDYEVVKNKLLKTFGGYELTYEGNPEWMDA